MVYRCVAWKKYITYKRNWVSVGLNSERTWPPTTADDGHDAERDHRQIRTLTVRRQNIHYFCIFSERRVITRLFISTYTRLWPTCARHFQAFDSALSAQNTHYIAGHVKIISDKPMSKTFCLGWATLRRDTAGSTGVMPRPRPHREPAGSRQRQLCFAEWVDGAGGPTRQ